ncbi:hypothetical protein B0H10DRAFT_2016253 [Mycena sp. CBHHK59/15]|nr:hypothetical protein B0H10DRAFT_2016253 [Mycena sp. CBHHK59/15]
MTPSKLYPLSSRPSSVIPFRALPSGTRLVAVGPRISRPESEIECAVEAGNAVSSACVEGPTCPTRGSARQRIELQTHFSSKLFAWVLASFRLYFRLAQSCCQRC